MPGQPGGWWGAAGPAASIKCESYLTLPIEVHSGGGAKAAGGVSDKISQLSRCIMQLRVCACVCVRVSVCRYKIELLHLRQIKLHKYLKSEINTQYSRPH